MKKLLRLLLIFVLLLTGCQNNTKDKIASKEETPKTADNVVAMDTSKYVIQEEGIKKAVEEYLDKEITELSETDYQKLSQLDYFIVKEAVTSLKDIEVLFPNIKYLSITVDELSEKEYTDINNLKELKALTLYCNSISLSDFDNDLEYFEIAYQDSENLPEINMLSHFSIDEKNLMNNRIEEGNIEKIVRIQYENNIYELVSTNKYTETDFYQEQERIVFVYEEDSLLCKSVLEATAKIGSDVGNQLQLVDTNFDGKVDVLVDNGHFGAQGSVEYTCFLSINDDFVRCDSFSDITNPSIDNKNKKVLSTWRNSAASHSWAMYEFQNNEWIMTDCFTESLSENNLENSNWEYTIEALIDNNMQTIETFTTKDYTEEELHNKIYAENSYWGISSDKWNNLYNNGKMIDFSIYGSGDINQTIQTIISK